MEPKHYKLAIVVSIVLLLGSYGRWPYGYYMLLRVSVATTALLLWGLYSERNQEGWKNFYLGAGIIDALRLVVTSPPLLTLAIAGYFFTFAQLALLFFIVVFLVKANGLDTAVAGGVFAIIHGSAIPARIAWGAMAGRFVSSWFLLGLIGSVAMGLLIVLPTFREHPRAMLLATLFGLLPAVIYVPFFKFLDRNDQISWMNLLACMVWGATAGCGAALVLKGSPPPSPCRAPAGPGCAGLPGCAPCR